MQPKQSRRSARRQAFQILFAGLFQAEEAEVLLESTRQLLEVESDPYTDRLVSGVLAKQAELDNIFEPYLTAGWKKERLSKTSLVLLRLGLYEMLFMEELPDSVAINESVALAKKFADPKEAAFLNGVFGSVYRANHQGQTLEESLLEEEEDQ